MALITYPDKVTGELFTSTMSNEIKSVVNTNRNEADTSLGLRVLASSIVDDETPAGTMNDINVTFILAFTPVAGSVKLHWNGMRLKVGVGFTISSATITMTIAPSSGDTLVADYRK